MVVRIIKRLINVGPWAIYEAVEGHRLVVGNRLSDGTIATKRGSDERENNCQDLFPVDFYLQCAHSELTYSGKDRYLSQPT
jgi:hypothetical protein